ncbi:MAG: Polyvinylalcohol dehydrogenase precursor, partial [Pseudomonadota bacterium]
APMLKEKWRAKIAGFPPGTPIVAEGRVFVHATGGTYAFSLLDGTKLWERADIMGTSSMAYADGFVYVHAYSTELYKLDPATGKTVWGPVKSFPTEGCDGESSPIVAGTTVLVGHSCGPLETSTTGPKFETALGGVEAFDIATGTLLWTYLTVPKTGENGAMVWSTVSVDVANKVVFAGTGNNYTVQGENSDAIHAIDLTTGMRLWKTQVHNNDTWSLGSIFLAGPDTDFGANPIIMDIDGQQVVADGDKGAWFHAFDRKTGKILWQIPALSTSRNQANGGVLMNGGFDGKNIYVVSNQPSDATNKAVLHALDPRKMGADVWKKNLPALTWGAPATANGVLVVPNNTSLLVYNAATGDMLNTFETGGTIAAGSAAIVDGYVVVGSGLSYALDASCKANDQIIAYAVPDAKAPVVMPGTGGPTAPVFTPGSATFTAIYEEIIKGQGCAGGPTCHASSTGGNLVMVNKADAYKALVGVKAAGAPCAASGLSRVVAGSPTTSLFVDKVEAATPKCGAHMPPGGTLSAAQIKQIKDWITAGAKDD